MTEIIFTKKSNITSIRLMKKKKKMKMKDNDDEEEKKQKYNKWN